MKIGDVVQLKCGSYSMVVSDRFESGAIECVWHDQNGVANRCCYPEAVLMPVEQKKMGIAKGE